MLRPSAYEEEPDVPEIDGLMTTVVSAVGRGLTTASLDGVCRDAVLALAADGAAVDGAAVTLAAQLGDRPLVGGSNDDARWLEQVQLTFGEGPCTEATLTGLPVIASDLRSRHEVRWPMALQALAAGPIQAVIAIPLLVGRTAVGSLDVHSCTAHGLDTLRIESVVGVGQLMLVAVLALRARDPDEAALGLPALVPQATGMVLAALGLSARDALDRLRGLAFVQGRMLADVARDVVEGRQSPDLTTAVPGPPD